MLRFRFATALLCFAALLTCTDTAATTLEKLSLERMTDIAHVIVRARCASNESRWDGAEIWTFTSFEVSETWKGVASTELTVRLLGGTVGALKSSIDGVPRFREGEEVILFLEATKHGGFTVVSWDQGTFRIVGDQRTGLEIVTQDTAIFETFDPEARQFKVTGIHDVPLKEFRARVKAAIAESARRSS